MAMAMATAAEKIGAARRIQGARARKQTLAKELLATCRAVRTAIRRQHRHPRYAEMVRAFGVGQPASAAKPGQLLVLADGIIAASDNRRAQPSPASCWCWPTVSSRRRTTGERSQARPVVGAGRRYHRGVGLLVRARGRRSRAGVHRPDQPSESPAGAGARRHPRAARPAPPAHRGGIAMQCLSFVKRVLHKSVRNALSLKSAQEELEAHRCTLAVIRSLLLGALKIDKGSKLDDVTIAETAAAHLADLPTLRQERQRLAQALDALVTPLTHLRRSMGGGAGSDADLIQRASAKLGDHGPVLAAQARGYESVLRSLAQRLDLPPDCYVRALEEFDAIARMLRGAEAGYKALPLREVVRRRNQRQIDLEGEIEFSQSQQELACASRNHWKAEAERLLRERDEARAEAAKVRKIADADLRRAVAAEQERDHLRGHFIRSGTDLAKERRDAGLLQIAEDVHISRTGGMGRTDAEQREDEAILYDALTHWKPPVATWAARYDDAVKALIEAALDLPRPASQIRAEPTWHPGGDIRDGWCSQCLLPLTCIQGKHCEGPREESHGR